MLENESTKHHWLRIGAIALMTFIIAFIAFYCVMELMLHRMTDPYVQCKNVLRKLCVNRKEKFSEN